MFAFISMVPNFYGSCYKTQENIMKGVGRGSGGGGGGGGGLISSHSEVFCKKMFWKISENS